VEQGFSVFDRLIGECDLHAGEGPGPYQKVEWLPLGGSFDWWLCARLLLILSKQHRQVQLAVLQ
jgi:hypothetical protein